MKKFLGYLLIVLGIGIIAYPFASKWYFNYMNNKLLSQYESVYDLQEVSTEESNASFEALDQIFVEGSSDTNLGENLLDESIYDAEFPRPEPTEEPVVEEPEPEPVEPPKEEKPKVQLPIIGRIKIPKIGVKMAILEGATEYHLNLGAAHITGTSKIGSIGNAGIAGHRGRSYGLMFNRLDELTIGDTIEISSYGKTYVYEVYKTHLVDPSDITVLYGSKEYAVLTLVTCDPVVNPTHRLIVHAILKK